MSQPDDATLEVSDLQRVPLLADLDRSQVASLVPAADVRRVPAGEVIFRAGDPGRELHVVLDGEVTIELEGAGERTTPIARLSEGTVFGEIGYLLGANRTATARASRDCRLMVLERSELEALEGPGREAVRHVMETLARVLAVRLAEMDREMVAFARTIAEAHPETEELVRRLSSRRDRLMHEWSF